MMSLMCNKEVELWPIDKIRMQLPKCSRLMCVSDVIITQLYFSIFNVITMILSIMCAKYGLAFLKRVSVLFVALSYFLNIPLVLMSKSRHINANDLPSTQLWQSVADIYILVVISVTGWFFVVVHFFTRLIHDFLNFVSQSQTNPMEIHLSTFKRSFYFQK